MAQITIQSLSLSYFTLEPLSLDPWPVLALSARSLLAACSPGRWGKNRPKSGWNEAPFALGAVLTNAT